MNLFDSLKEFIAHSNFSIDLIDSLEQYCYDKSSVEGTISIQNEYFFFASNNKEEMIKLSKSAKQIIGYSQSDLPLNLVNIIEPGKVEFEKRLKEKHEKIIPLSVYRYKIIHKNGGFVYVDTISINSYDEKGTYLSKVGVAHNVTKHVKSSETLHKNLLYTIEALSTALELRDPYTAGHMSSTARLSVEIGKLFNFSEAKLEGLLLGATMHDIGKIALPLEVLNKNGKLNNEEWSLIKEHPLKGTDIIKNIEFDSPVNKMVEQHHERIDGSGYPLGLNDEEIILEAKIIAVADSFDAMTADRPYRKALSKIIALKIINEEKGIKLCSNVVSKLNDLDKKGYLDIHTKT